MPYITVGGNYLYYKECGLGNPAILIHGSCLNSEMWNDSFDILAHKRQVIAYDQRGYAKSRFTSQKKYSHENDLNILHETLKLGKADLIGLSSGAQIAVNFYLQFPDKVNSLVLVSPALSGGPENYETTEIDAKILTTINRKQYRQTVQLIYSHPVFAQAIHNTRCNSLLRGIIKNHDFQKVTNNPPASKPLDSASKLREIKTPTLIILGENDLNHFHVTTSLLNKGIENSVLKTVNDSGHMVNMEQPIIFNQLLLSFLQNQSNI